MSSKFVVANAIFEGISIVREDEELQDFVVEVEGKEFKCHRLILSACSGFFRGLFKSGMRESQEKRTKLEGVSVETFATILDTLYTGSENLTRNNMLNVWLAADQLQITVIKNHTINFICNNICNETVIPVWKVASQLMQENLMKLCHTFITNNLNLQNLENIYKTANSIGSDLILSHIQDFIKTNFENVIKSETFLCLRENDLFEIIKSQDLVVSCEDVVVDSVLNWVNNGIAYKKYMIEDQCLGSEKNVEKEHELNELKDHINKENEENNVSRLKYSTGAFMKCLERLLSEMRLCLVKPLTLEKLFHHPLVVNNTLSKEIVMDAILYQSIGHQHGQWPKGAIHRSCSDLENVGVMASQKEIFYALRKSSSFKWYQLPECLFLKNNTSVKLFAYMSDVFAVLGFKNSYTSLCVFGQSDWRELCFLPGNGWLGVAVEEFIYLINSSSQQIKRFRPKLGNCIPENFIFVPTDHILEHVCSLDTFIIVFYSAVVDGQEETAAHCLDTRSKTWRKLDSLEGSAKSMVSFKKEKQLYILQTNGSMWEINKDEYKGVNLNLVGALWQGNNELYGAICFNDVLYLFGSKCFDDNILQLSLFSSIITNGSAGCWSNIVPAIVRKSVFK